MVIGMTYEKFKTHCCKNKYHPGYIAGPYKLSCGTCQCTPPESGQRIPSWGLYLFGVTTVFAWNYELLVARLTPSLFACAILFERTKIVTARTIK